nr:SGNH hydrolase domain-containing protein [Alteromonas profundi]
MGLHFYENGIQRYPDKGKVVHINKANDNAPSYLMIGDSNAAHYAYGMAEVDDRHYLLSWISSCLNFPDYTTKPYADWMDKKWLKQCQNNYKTLYDYDELDVILAQHWYKKNGVICVSEECSLNLSLVTYNDFLLNQLEKLVSIVGTNRNLYIVGFVPAPANSVVTCMKKIFNSDCERKSSAFSPERIEINRLLENFSTRFSNVHFIDPFQAVCNDQPVCTTVINDKNLFFDEGHLSQFGSQVMWEYIASELP